MSKRKHGQRTPIRRSWEAMLSRCYDPTVNCYSRYGQRGITVCDRWRYSFPNFVEDMGERPEGMSLDRVDNNGNYEPSNCRWVTPKDQQNNKANNRVVTLDGVSLTLAQWAEQTGMSRKTISNRLDSGWSPLRALTIAPRQLNSGTSSTVPRFAGG